MIYEASSSRVNDRYLTLLMAVLLGYALIGKGVAYLGVGPIFIGEISYLLGLAAALKSRCIFASLTSLPSIVLAAMMAWVLFRTVPFVDTYGFDALRDSVVIMYGGFAFIVVALLVEDPQRLETLLNSYRIFATAFVMAIPFVLLIDRYLRDHVPLFPGYGFPIIEVRTGEAAVHLAGAAIFSIVGFGKITKAWLAMMIAGLVLVVVGRAALLAFVVPVAVATIMRGKLRELAKVVAVGLIGLGAAYAFEASIVDYQEATNSETRTISVEQVVENAESIVGYGGEQTESTKKWRLDWWSIIIADTVYGPDF